MAARKPLAVPPKTAEAIDANEIGEAVYRKLLANDEAERVMGDDRRRIGLVEYSDDAGKEIVIDRASKWPDLIDVPPSSSFGMQTDHAMVYGEFAQKLADEYRAVYARRDPSIVSAETSMDLKQRGATFGKSSEQFQAGALEVLRAHVRGL